MKKCTRCKEDKPFECFSRAKSRKDGYNGFCKVCHKTAKADWKIRNMDSYLEQGREYMARYRKQYPEKVAESISTWSRKNRAYFNERDRRRTAAKKNATPAWGKIDVMRTIYSLADKKTKTTKVEHQVDHIVPLTSDKVCGFHVEWNLQVITKFENGSKNNRWWPDMWED